MLVFFFTTMSKRISLKKLGHMARESKGTSLAATLTSVVKGISIGEKGPWGETPNIEPAAKGKQASDTKDKEHMSPVLTKKKATWRLIKK